MKTAVFPLLQYPETGGLDVEEGEDDAHSQDHLGGHPFEVAKSQLGIEGLNQFLDLFFIHPIIGHLRILVKHISGHGDSFLD